MTATYNVDGFESVELRFSSPKELVEKVMGLPFAHKVLAIRIVEHGNGFEIAGGKC